MSIDDAALPSRPRAGARRSYRERTWDGSMVDELRAFQETGEPDIVAEILATFCRDADEVVRVLVAASAAKDCVAVEYAAHRLRGGSLSVGARKVAAAAQELEQAAHARADDRFAKLAEDVTTAWARFVAETGDGDVVH